MSRPQVLVRDATPRDAAALATMWREHLRRTDAIPAGETVRVTEENLARIEADPAHRVLVAECDEVVVGAVVARLGMVSPILSDRSLQMNHLCVDPAYSRKGVGRALVDAALTWAEERGAVTLMVGSTPGDRDVNRFLTRLGLAQVAVMRGATVTALRAKLPLDPAVAARVGARNARSRSVGAVVAVRRTQRRSRARGVAG